MAEKEYIERDAAYKACETYFSGVCVYDVSASEAINDFEEVIDAVPTADVVPIRHGHWIAEYDCGYITPHCSECGETALTKEETSYDYVYSSYCPRCGAIMDGNKVE